MQQVVVVFVAVEPAKMSDPGPQLQKVLEFRSTIEAEKRLLYHQVEGERDFADILRGHLAQWVRDHETRGKGDAPEPEKPNAPAGPAAPAPDEHVGDGSDLLLRAARLSAEANFTEAERLLAVAAAKNDNPAALLAYAELLARLNRRRQAISAFEQAADLAQDLGDVATAARSFGTLARLHDDLGNGDAAEAAAMKALDLHQGMGNDGGAAAARILLGERRRRTGSFDEAAEQYRLAIELASRGGEPGTEGNAWIGLSEVYRDLGEIEGDPGRLGEAREALCNGIALKQKAGITDLGDAYAALGAILERLGDEEGADKHYRMSLDLFRQKGDKPGVADAADHLAQICLRRGHVQEAEDAFRDSAATFEVLQNVEGAADAYLSLGRLQAMRGALEEAEESFRAALALAHRRKGEAAQSLQKEITTLLEDVLARQSGTG